MDDSVVPESSRVLVVDDDEGIRELVELALGDEGYQVTSAANGALALEALRQATPSVILVDTRMPVMDGLEFVRVYREQPPPHAPIIVLTAAADADAIADRIAADAVLQKPFDLEDLLQLIGRFSPPPSPAG